VRAVNSALGFAFGMALTAVFCQSCFGGHTLTYGGKFDLRIPGDGNSTKGWMADAVVEVPEHITISDLDVIINIKHTHVFDLKLLLQGPDGSEICLNSYKVSDFFEGDDYLDTIFDDEADEDIGQGKPPFSGKFKPKQGNNLNIFDDTDAFGQWRLRIEDFYYMDAGYLKKFELRITVPEPASVFLFCFGGLVVRRFYRKKA